MKICFAILLFFASGVAAQDVAFLLAEADQYYQQRETAGEVDKAIATLQKILSIDPNHYEAASKLAKAYWYQANHAPKNEKRNLFQNGVDAAKKAVAIAPDRCEGHFWLGINYALYAENSNPFQALGLVGKVKQEMERAMAIENDCVCGGPQRVLGKFYAKIPWFKGGSKSKSIEYLKKSIEICPEDTQSRIFLAQTYLDQGKKDLAREQVELVLQMEGLPDWTPETKENKIEAEQILARLNKK
jgi:tetratricopeptide (TPR) repeat protein